MGSDEAPEPTLVRPLQGERATLRPAARADLPRFLEILGEPEVARWWGQYSGEWLAAQLFASGSVPFAIELDGRVVGWIAYEEEPDPLYRFASVDIALETSGQNRGLGTDALRTLARHLFRRHGHHRLTIDPAADNERAIHAYAKVGFKPVGVMRRYEFRDGQWRDSLLMDMLADELT